jgi:hypothetical protein
MVPIGTYCFSCLENIHETYRNWHLPPLSTLLTSRLRLFTLLRYFPLFPPRPSTKVHTTNKDKPCSPIIWCSLNCFRICRWEAALLDSGRLPIVVQLSRCCRDCCGCSMVVLGSGCMVRRDPCVLPQALAIWAKSLMLYNCLIVLLYFVWNEQRTSRVAPWLHFQLYSYRINFLKSLTI